jgi:hypothetical protein
MMASLLGGGSTGEGGIPPSTVDSVSMRKTWEVSSLLSSGRVGSIDDRDQIDHLGCILQGENGVDGWKQIDRLSFTL